MSSSINPKTLVRVLIIQENEEQRTVVREALQDEYLILEANNGINGIDLATDTEPQLILVDIDLTDMNGFEVATRLRTLFPKVPLVALAEEFLLMTKDFGLAVGFAGFITKPFDVGQVQQSVARFLTGERDELTNRDEYLIAHQSELATRLEEKVRESHAITHRAKFLVEQNSRMIKMLQRRQQLLENAAHVGKVLTSILNLNELLPAAVDIICQKYNFYYAGIFLLDATGEWAELRAGYGEAGAAMLTAGHKLEIGGQSMIGDSIKERKAIIALDVGLEQTHFKNPHLPNTRSEMALPLVVKNKNIGAISIQSSEEYAFSDDDVTALQTLADQLAVAIQNAQLLQDLENANSELLRTKTYEAIATATGEAIHWVGNKAAPIPGSAGRIRDDLNSILAVFNALLKLPEEERTEHTFWGVFENILETLELHQINLGTLAEELSQMPARRLGFLVGMESILEDLEIIEQSANTILHIKEDLIGPARQQKSEALELNELLQRTAKGMGYPKEAVTFNFSPEAQPVLADPQQTERVFINLIKNAWEAMDGQPDPHITLSTHPTEDAQFTEIRVTDNGPGIPPEILEKIWVSFFTTKKETGGTGLGLSACMEIVNQSDGKILVDSEVGQGTTFTVLLPVAH